MRTLHRPTAIEPTVLAHGNYKLRGTRISIEEIEYLRKTNVFKFYKVCTANEMLTSFEQRKKLPLRQRGLLTYNWKWHGLEEVR